MAPYICSGQSLVCNVEATPHVRSIDDLHGMIVGVQQGNTSEPVAQRLKEEGRIAGVRTYAYHDIGVMLDDLAAGRIGAVMKLAPVMHWLKEPALLARSGRGNHRRKARRCGPLGERNFAAGDRWGAGPITRKRRAYAIGEKMAPGMTRCVHLYTGADGWSHVENTEIPLGVVQSTKAAHFEEIAAGSALAWHTALLNNTSSRCQAHLSSPRATASHSCSGLVMFCWRLIQPERGIAGACWAISRGGASMSRLPGRESEKLSGRF